MNLSAVYFIISYLVFVISLVSGQQSYSTKLETELRNYLFTGYDALQRPNQTVSTQVTLNLLTVNSLDIKEQQLSVSGYFYMIWTDSRLSWASNTTYSNIQFLFSNENYMWRPAVIVENSVSDMSVISDTNTYMRITSDGSATWTPGGIYQTHCDCDVTYYPLDTQTCSVVLSTWAYTANEISLSLSSSVVDRTYYSENGEWEILSVSGTATSTTRESQSFSRLKFTLTLRRRPLFHILNTFIPVFIMATLIVIVFKLPPDSGERIGMSLTALLAYAVYLTLISDNIPKTSKAASLLSIYLTIILFLSALSILLTIFILDFYFNVEGDKVPAWLNRFTHNVMVKFSCWKGNACFSRENEVTPTDEVTVCSSSNTVLKLDEKKVIPNAGLEKKRKLSMDTTCSDDSTIPEYSWKEIALIMDKCCLYMFMILVILATLIIFVILGAKY